jgi:hypothetical protein
VFYVLVVENEISKRSGTALEVARFRAVKMPCEMFTRKSVFLTPKKAEK